MSLDSVYHSPHASALALHLVHEQYGDLPEVVCRCLIERGAQSLPELVRSLHPKGRTAKEIREALLLLIQQNCVNCYLQTNEANLRGPATSFQVYIAAPAEICQGIRKPRFLLHIRDEAGEMPEVVLECLLEHGRLRLDQVVTQVSCKLEKDPGEVRVQVVGALTSMVHARYVERAPPCTLPVPQQTPFTAKIKSKAAKAEEALERAQREAPHAAYQKERFRLPHDLYDYSETGEMPVQSGTQDGEAVGQKRKAYGEASADGGTAEEDSIATLTWRANTEEFNRRFRHAAIVDFVREKMDDQSALVIETLLAVSRTSETTLREQVTRPVNVSEVRSALERKASASGDPQISQIDAASKLRDMADAHSTMVAFNSDTAYGATYTVSMETIINHCRLKETEGVVRQRFGVAALRIFRLLGSLRLLEQKQIAEMVMSPIKATRELLYTMFKGGFVCLQEVPKTADHTPSRTIYLWRGDYEETFSRLAAELYKVAANIGLRTRTEYNREKDVLERVESGNLTKAEILRCMRMKKVLNVLSISLLRLDEQIAIFNDF